jgi:AcrR family transcriptional regulator
MASQRKAVSSPAKKAPGRRSPISRQEGERRMVAAATSLLRAQPFSTVGVRDIAALADVNQGFIHTWFGSQHHLYLRVVQELFASMLEPMERQPSDAVALNPFDADVQFAVRLLFWLDLEGVDTSSVIPQLNLLMDGFSRRLISSVGIDAHTAEAITMQGSAIGLGTAAFGHLIGADDAVRFAHTTSVWRHQLELLAKHPPK